MPLQDKPYVLLIVAATLVVLLAGCSTSAATPKPVEASFPAPTDPSPRDEIETSGSPPGPPSPCEVTIEAAHQVAAGEDHPELPEPWTIVYADKPNPVLEARYGWHPLGALVGPSLTVWPDLHPTPEAVTFTTLHELGHLADQYCLSSAEHTAWSELRGLDGPWTTDGPYASPNEDFADSFAVCLGEDPKWWTVDGAPPDAEACHVLAELID